VFVRFKGDKHPYMKGNDNLKGEIGHEEESIQGINLISMFAYVIIIKRYGLHLQFLMEYVLYLLYPKALFSSCFYGV